MRARSIGVCLMVMCCTLHSQKSAAKPTPPAAKGDMTATTALGYERLAESLRATLTQWTPSLHALVLEGQMPGATPKTPIPAAVMATWLELSRQQQQVLGPPLRGDAGLAAWQVRLAQSIHRLTEIERLEDVLSAGHRVLEAAENLTHEIEAGLELGSQTSELQAHPTVAPVSLPEPKVLAHLTLARSQQLAGESEAAAVSPPAFLALPGQYGRSVAGLGLLHEHLDTLGRLLGQMATPPLDVGHDLVAQVWLEGAEQGQLKVTWASPGPGHVVPSRLRLRLRDARPLAQRELSQVASCQGLEGSAKDRAVAAGLRDLKDTWVELAEMSRAANHFTTVLSPSSAWLPKEVALAPLSPFGVEGRSHVVPVERLSTRLQPPVAVEAQPLAPTLDDPLFYRGLDAVVVHWQPAVGDLSSRKSPEDPSPRGQRFDIFRLPPTSHLELSASTDGEQQAWWPPVVTSRLPPEAVFVGSVPLDATSFVDRPGPENLKRTSRYVVTVADANDRRLVGPEVCSVSGMVRWDVFEALALAREGGDRLRHPTAYERSHAVLLASSQARALSQRVFSALPESHQTRLWRHFWDHVAPEQKRRWRQTWPELLGEQGRRQIKEQAEEWLDEATRRFVHTLLFAEAHPALIEAASRQWRLLDVAARREVMRHFLKLPFVSSPSFKEAGEEATVDASPLWSHPERLWHWSQMWDAEDHEAIDLWWHRKSRQEAQQALQVWLDKWPEAQINRLLWPLWGQMTPNAQQAFLDHAPAHIPDGLWPAFLSRLAFEDLSFARKLEIVRREVPPWTRWFARVRYAVRPLDIWVDFERGTALAVGLAGFLMGWLIYAAIARPLDEP